MSSSSPDPAEDLRRSTDLLLRSARARLVDSGLGANAAAQEARLLLADLVGCGTSELLLMADVSGADGERFAELVERRATGVPVQHLTGLAHFRHLSLAVGPGVFIPRPETEVMTGWAIEQLRVRLSGQADRDSERAPIAVDLCAGSGAVVAALDDEAPGAQLFAVEVSESAADYARRNLTGRPVELRVEDIATTLPELNGRVDLITANPPYIPLEAWESVAAEVRDHDPELALFSGADGLEAITVVAAVAARLLRPGGVFCCEHAELQESTAPAVFARTGVLLDIRDHHDLNNRPRFVTGRRL